MGIHINRKQFTKIPIPPWYYIWVDVLYFLEHQHYHISFCDHQIDTFGKKLQPDHDKISHGGTTGLNN